MKSSSDLKLTMPRSLLFIGAPGTGKTTFALQLPKPYIIDCDDNLIGPTRHLKSSGKDKPYFYDTPLRDDTGKPVPRDKQYLRLITLLDEAVSSPEVETIVIDSLSSLVEMLMAHTLVSLKKPLATDFKVADRKFEYEDWAAFGNFLRRLIFELKATGKRFVLTAHIKVEQDELSKTLFKFINCPGAVQNYISGWFEEAWEFFIQTTGVAPNEKAVRKIRTVPDTRSAPLGLKTAAGLASTVEADADTILSKFT